MTERYQCLVTRTTCVEAGFEWLRTLSVATSMVTVGRPIAPHLSLTSKVMEHVPAAVVLVRRTSRPPRQLHCKAWRRSTVPRGADSPAEFAAAQKAILRIDYVSKDDDRARSGSGNTDVADADVGQPVVAAA